MAAPHSVPIIAQSDNVGFGGTFKQVLRFRIDMLFVVLSALLFGTISASAQGHVAAERLLAKKGLLIYTGALLTVHGRQTMLPLLSSSNVYSD